MANSPRSIEKKKLLM
jgi:1-deoxy-D-xylulose 5-phosphate reductoisomerase